MNKHITTTLFAVVLLACIAFNKAPSLKGNWQYCGGIYNGKKSAAPTGYQLQRKYDKEHFTLLLLEPDTTAQQIARSDYQITADSCLETETFSKIPSKLTGIVVHYSYTLKHDTLTLKGKLPTGMQVEEYWKKMK
ncbi:hypothetical protein GCM10027037_10850 [Mucilaginibacter koreensis]